MPSTGSINAEGKEQRGSAAHLPTKPGSLSEVTAIPAGIRSDLLLPLAPDLTHPSPLPCSLSRPTHLSLPPGSPPGPSGQKHLPSL